MPAYLGDRRNNTTGGLTLAPAVITADVATNPSISVDLGAGEGLVTMTVMTGAVHAETTAVITPVESTSGSNGTWTTLGVAADTVTLDTTDATTVRRSFNRTKRYVGALVDLSGSTLSAGIAILVEQQTKHTA